jgi:hypothetical protein
MRRCFTALVKQPVLTKRDPLSPRVQSSRGTLAQAQERRRAPSVFDIPSPTSLVFKSRLNTPNMMCYHTLEWCDIGEMYLHKWTTDHRTTSAHAPRTSQSLQAAQLALT